HLLSYWIVSVERTFLVWAEEDFAERLRWCGSGMGCASRTNFPRSPWETSSRKERYWTGRGRSSPSMAAYSSRAARLPASSSPENMRLTGSPGMMRRTAKTITVTPKRTTAVWPKPWSTSLVIGWSVAHGHVVQLELAARVRLEARHAFRHGPRLVGDPQRNPRRVLHDSTVDLLLYLVPGVQVGLLLGLGDEFVDLRITETRIHDSGRPGITMELGVVIGTGELELPGGEATEGEGVIASLVDFGEGRTLQGYDGDIETDLAELFRHRLGQRGVGALGHHLDLISDP